MRNSAASALTERHLSCVTRTAAIINQDHSKRGERREEGRDEMRGERAEEREEKGEGRGEEERGREERGEERGGGKERGWRWRIFVHHCYCYLLFNKKERKPRIRI